MSALLPKADKCSAKRNVGYGPKSDIRSARPFGRRAMRDRAGSEMHVRRGVVNSDHPYEGGSVAGPPERWEVPAEIQFEVARKTIT